MTHPQPPSPSSTCILKVLVGSQAHGLAEDTSDRDLRSVFAIPTADFFRIGFVYHATQMTQQGDDDTAWEVGRFLHLALQGHPLVLETLMAPVVTMDEWGAELRRLFPHLWTPQAAYDAFLNYGRNQRKKLLEKKDGRPAKYAAAYLRVLFNLCELLERGAFTVRITETPVGDLVRRVKAGDYRLGEVIDAAAAWEEEATRRLARCSHHARPDLADAFLLKLRKARLE